MNIMDIHGWLHFTTMANGLIAILASCVGLMLILASYYYATQWRELDYCGNVWLDECPMQTGDLIWMKATDNNYAPCFISRATHIGIVVRDPHDGQAYIYEAAQPSIKSLKPTQRSAGIFWTRAVDRIRRYKGYCYWQPISRAPSDERVHGLLRFIRDTAHLFTYNNKHIITILQKTLGFRGLNFQTNCGELVVLALIQLGILASERLNDKVKHSLWYVQDINEKCVAPYHYGPLYKIIDSPVGDAPQIAAQSVSKMATQFAQNL